MIYKMHGTVVPKMGEFDSYVVTEDDYVEFLSRMSSAVPSLLLDLFRTRSFCFWIWFERLEPARSPQEREAVT
jgi:hypothetical protein